MWQPLIDYLSLFGTVPSGRRRDELPPLPDYHNNDMRPRGNMTPPQRSYGPLPARAAIPSAMPAPQAEVPLGLPAETDMAPRGNMRPAMRPMAGVGPMANDPGTSTGVVTEDAVMQAVQGRKENNLDFQALMAGLPPEIRQRVNAGLDLAEREAQAVDEQVAAQDQLARQSRQTAEQKRRAYDTAVKAPLKLNNFALSLNTAIGNFAAMLTGNGTFIKRADEMREYEIGEARERRLENLKMLERDATKAADRADQLADIAERDKALSKVTKLQQQIAVIKQANEQYYNLRDKQKLIAMEHALRIQAMVTEAKMKTGGMKLSPEVQAKLDVLESVYKADAEAAKKQLDLAGDMLKPEDRDAAMRKAMARLAEISEKYISDTNALILGVTQNVTAPTKPVDRATKLQQILGQYVRERGLNTSVIIHDLEETLKNGDPNDAIRKEIERNLVDEYGQPLPYEKVYPELVQMARKVVPMWGKKAKRLESLQRQVIIGQQYGDHSDAHQARIAEYNKLRAELDPLGLISEDIYDVPQFSLPLN